jgi:hypothetical protein
MKKLLNVVKRFFSNLSGWAHGFWILKISTKDRLYSFYGYSHFKFAKQYADKRYVRNGLRHWVLPAGQGAEQLVVFNVVEKKLMKRQGHIGKHVTVKDLLKAAYYVTPINGKNHGTANKSDKKGN